VPYLVAGMLLVGGLCLLDLVLTLGVIRRLRVHTELLSRRGPGGQPPPMIPAGSTAGDFTTTTVDGETVSRAGLEAQTLVGFFTPHCGACKERLPDFVASAAAAPGGRDRVLAVIVGSVEDAAEYRDELSAVARVVIEEGSTGSIVGALQVTAYPTFVVLDGDATVLASGYTLDDLPVPVAG
jgi:thiol-disulfide isomerase/thioredoxin